MAFSLPPEITVKQIQRQQDFIYEFRHKNIGELGRLVIKGMGASSCHFSVEVAGDPSDPLTTKRREILEPITSQMIAIVEEKTKGKSNAEQMAQVEVPKQSPKDSVGVHAQLATCAVCKKPVCHFIFAENAQTQDVIEDYYRLMYSKMAEINLPTWIVGAEKTQNGKLMDYALRAWPVRDETSKFVSHEDIDAEVRHLQNSHCKI